MWACRHVNSMWLLIDRGLYYVCVTLHGFLLTAGSGGTTQQYCNTTHTFLGVFTNSTVDERPSHRRKTTSWSGFHPGLKSLCSWDFLQHRKQLTVRALLWGEDARPQPAPQHEAWEYNATLTKTTPVCFCERHDGICRSFFSCSEFIFSKCME